MNADIYQHIALETANTELTSLQQLDNGLKGLNGEAGEAIDHLKKHQYQGHELNPDYMIKELGDILWYCAITAHALDIKLSDVMKLNVEKLRARYPDGFSSDRSINREDG